MRRITLLAIGGGVLAVGALALTSKTPPSEKWRTVHGLPLPVGISIAQYEAEIQNWSGGTVNTSKPMPPELVATWNVLQAGFAERRKLLPPDAKPYQDGYSTEEYLVAQPPTGSPGMLVQKTDQWGRVMVAAPGTGGFDPLGQVLTYAGYALPFVPGIGPAASAALAAAIALGKGQSLKDAALAGARASLPAPAQVMFDLGVGVVLQGKPLDKAAKQALFKQLPGGEKAYNQGVTLAKQVL